MEQTGPTTKKMKLELLYFGFQMFNKFDFGLANLFSASLFEKFYMCDLYLLIFLLISR